MKVYNKIGSKERLKEIFQKVNKIKLNESFDSPKSKDEKYLNKGGDKKDIDMQPNKYDDGVREPRERDIQVKDKSLEKLKGDDKPIVSENLDKSRFNKYIGKELEIGVIEDIDMGGGDFMIGFKQPAEIDTIQFTPNGAKIYKTEGGGFRDVTNDYKNGLGLVADKWLTLIWNEVSSQAREMGVDMADTFTGYRRSINQNNESSIIEGGLGNYDVYSSPEWVEARKEKFGDRKEYTPSTEQQPQKPEIEQPTPLKHYDNPELKNKQTLDFLEKKYANLKRQGQEKTSEGMRTDGQYFQMTGKHLRENDIREETEEVIDDIDVENLDTGEEEIDNNEEDVNIDIQQDQTYNELNGGLGDDATPSEFDPEQISRGIKVEMEHTNDPKIALEISMDHLTEHPQYYGEDDEDPDKEAMYSARTDVDVENPDIEGQNNTSDEVIDMEGENPENMENDDLSVNMNWLDTLKPNKVEDMEVMSTDLGEAFGEEEEFIPQGSYTVSNAGGYEIMLNDSGDAAKVRDAYGSDNPETSDWLEIEYVQSEEGESEPVIDPNGYNIPLNQVMRMNETGGNNEISSSMNKKKSGENSGVDLFDDYESLPKEVYNLYVKYSNIQASDGFDYKIVAEFLKEMEALGYTFDYYLDAEPYNLRKMEQ